MPLGRSLASQYSWAQLRERMQLETEGEAVKSQDEGDVSAYHKYLVTLVSTPIIRPLVKITFRYFRAPIPQNQCSSHHTTTNAPNLIEINA